MSLEIPRGRGVLKANLLEEKYEARLEFPEGWGGTKQKAFRGSIHVGIFWNYAMYVSGITFSLPLLSSPFEPKKKENMPDCRLHSFVSHVCSMDLSNTPSFIPWGEGFVTSEKNICTGR